MNCSPLTLKYALPGSIAGPLSYVGRFLNRLPKECSAKSIIVIPAHFSNYGDRPLCGWSGVWRYSFCWRGAHRSKKETRIDLSSPCGKPKGQPQGLPKAPLQPRRPLQKHLGYQNRKNNIIPYVLQQVLWRYIKNNYAHSNIDKFVKYAVMHFTLYVLQSHNKS